MKLELGTIGSINISTSIDVLMNTKIRDESIYTINKYLPSIHSRYNREPGIIHFNFFVTYERDGAHHYVEVNGAQLYEIDENSKYSLRKEEAIKIIRNKFGITDLLEDDFEFIDSIRSWNDKRFITTI